MAEPQRSTFSKWVCDRATVGTCAVLLLCGGGCSGPERYYDRGLAKAKNGDLDGAIADQTEAIHNGIKGMVLAVNDAADTTDALIFLSAARVCRDIGFLDIPDNYFDTTRLATVWDATDDVLIFGDKAFELVA